MPYLTVIGKIHGDQGFLDKKTLRQQYPTDFLAKQNHFTCYDMIRHINVLQNVESIILGNTNTTSVINKNHSAWKQYASTFFNTTAKPSVSTASANIHEPQNDITHDNDGWHRTSVQMFSNTTYCLLAAATLFMMILPLAVHPGTPALLTVLRLVGPFSAPALAGRVDRFATAWLAKMGGSHCEER